MIAFEIAIDGQRKCTAGVGEVGVVSVLATWVGRGPDPKPGQSIAGRFEEEVTLDVGGLTHDPDGGSVQVKWLQQPLKLGQRITLTLVETEVADPPWTRERNDPAWTERRKREYYERLKGEYSEE
jgi:hypothetical protein